MLPQLLRSSLETLRDEKAASWQAAYLLHQFPFLGVRTPILRKALRRFYKTHPFIDWRQDLETLWNQPEREFHYAAIELALYHKKEWVEADIALFERMIRSNSWWDTVDTIAPHLMGPLLQRFPNLISHIDQWIESDHLWLRRSSIIFQLRYKEKTDEKRLFRTCQTLAHEKEFFIRKAIGWALREYGKREGEAVKRFVEKTPLSPLSRREALKHLIK